VTALPALLYDGRTSATRRVLASLQRNFPGAALRLVLQGGDRIDEVPFADCVADVAVGRGVRRIELPDGATLEVPDGAAWDAMLAADGAARTGRALGALERRWIAALVALALTAVAVWASIKHGIPALVERGVHVIPTEVDARIGAGGLDLLDEQVFAPSALPKARQRGLRKSFARVAGDLGVHDRLRLEFRCGQAVGANAFALPDGIVIVTDELVALAQHEDELRAVFAHEIGHVHHRHAMRALLSSSLSTVVTLVVLGDVGSATMLVASIPTALAHAAYSRDFEREADATARGWLQRSNVPQGRLEDLLRRLEQQAGLGWSYLSTHPPLAERLHQTQG
jgi:Zn-dependent protease with chaperone function